MSIVDRLFNCLPETQSPNVSDRYAFIDTKIIVENMQDLGFYVNAFRYPNVRTQAGAYGLHEVDFRENQYKGKKGTKFEEVPRVLFHNSYDGSRRAKIMTGVFRLVCDNGLTVGNVVEAESFLHLGDHEEALVEQITAVGERSRDTLDQIERYKNISLDDPSIGFKMAEAALKLRDPSGDNAYKLDPATILMPRRKEDTKKDLWTRWNVLQENLLKGGIPSVNGDGNMRVTRPVTQIQKSSSLNQGLWDILEETADALV